MVPAAVSVQLGVGMGKQSDLGDFEYGLFIGI